jgi:hypothetical protein
MHSFLILCCPVLLPELGQYLEIELPSLYPTDTLDHETLDLVLQGADLSGQVTGLVRGDAGTVVNCVSDCSFGEGLSVL